VSEGVQRDVGQHHAGLTKSLRQDVHNVDLQVLLRLQRLLHHQQSEDVVVHPLQRHPDQPRQEPLLPLLPLCTVPAVLAQHLVGSLSAEEDGEVHEDVYSEDDAPVDAHLQKHENYIADYDDLGGDQVGDIVESLRHQISVHVLGRRGEAIAGEHRTHERVLDVYLDV
jgi:hypothetical protein